MQMTPATLLMPAWTPLGDARALPRLWPGFAAVCRQLAGRTWTLDAPAADVGATSSAHLRLCPGTPAHWGEALTLRLRWQGHVGELALDAAAQAWCLGDDVPGDAPLAWRQILLADRLMPMARAFLGSAPEWEASAAPWPRDVNTLWCELHALGAGPTSWPGACGLVRLRWASAEAWMALASVLQRLPPERARDVQAPQARRHLSACRIPLRLELGRTRLDLASLRGIERGDIVAVDEWRPRGPAIGVQLYAGRRGELQWAAEVRQNRLTVLPDPEPAMPAAPATSSSAPGASAVKADCVADGALPVEQLEKLEVTLHFDLGGLALNLEALGQVAAGHVLELPHALNQCELSILCQERVLGKGQLVAVGERLGVRVTEFAMNGHAAPA